MNQPRLTEVGRRSLEERLRRLEHERIPALEADAFAGDPAVVVALSAAKEEAEELRRTLVSAVSLADAPHDPDRVEVGDTVTIRPVGGGELERYTIVGDLEARVDDERISENAPMGTALLGRHIGEDVEVRAPGGVTRWLVTGIERQS